MDSADSPKNEYFREISLSEAGEGLLLADVDLVPQLGDRGARDADGRADLAHEVDGVGGVTLASWVVGLSAPECACLVTPLGDGLDGWGCSVTHGSFSLVVEAAEGQAMCPLTTCVVGVLQAVVCKVCGEGQAELGHAEQEYAKVVHGSFSKGHAWLVRLTREGTTGQPRPLSFLNNFW